MTHVKYSLKIELRTEKHWLRLVDTLGGSSLDEQVESEAQGSRGGRGVEVAVRSGL